MYKYIGGIAAIHIGKKKFNKMKINMAQGGRDNTTVIDVESLVSSMENKIMGKRLSLSPDHCIFRTPSILVQYSKEAYVPSTGKKHMSPIVFPLGLFTMTNQT